MSELTVEDIKNHFERKLADPENRRAARDLYALNEIMKLERQARIKPIGDNLPEGHVLKKAWATGD